MLPTAQILIIVLALLPALGHSFDAEFCGRGMLSAEELDRSHWDNHENVYVALVENAELVYPEDSMPRVYFSLTVDEIFKGAPESTGSVYSRRVVNGWNSDMPEILMGGWIDVFVGDRLLVFSNPNGEVSLGFCSASRVVEQGFSGIRDEASATLRRLEQWRDAL